MLKTSKEMLGKREKRLNEVIEKAAEVYERLFQDTMEDESTFMAKGYFDIYKADFVSVEAETKKVILNELKIGGSGDLSDRALNLAIIRLKDAGWYLKEMVDESPIKWTINPIEEEPTEDPELLRPEDC